MTTTSDLDALVRATPSSRDRSMDFLRAASIVAVVFGHWFISINHWEHGVIFSTSAVGVTPGLWLLTWVFQVMPIFFFVGGFSNSVALRSARRKGESTWAFIRGRLERLLRPSLVFLGLWAIVQVTLHLADIVGTPTGPRIWGDTTLLRGMKPPGATIPFGPLWFLGVYLVVVVIAPVTIWLHERFGLWVALAMALGAVTVDAVAFSTGDREWRWLNVAFVLLFPHQLGHAFADGTLARWPRRRFWAMVVGGLAGLVLLTTPWVFQLLGNTRFEWFPGIGHYPKSLLGTDVEVVSNAYPPTVCFLLGGVWTLAAVMLVKPRLDRWLRRERPWRFTIVVNARIMTLFLWHMTAFLLALLLLWPIGLGQEQDSTARWWLERPVWQLVPGVILLGLIAIFGRFERSGGREGRGG